MDGIGSVQGGIHSASSQACRREVAVLKARSTG